MEPDKLAAMAPEDRRQFEAANCFEVLSKEEQDNYKLPLRLVEQVLSSQALILAIPNYTNARSTAINVQLIKACIWIWQKGLMEPKDIHDVLTAYETKIFTLGIETLPLVEKVIAESLRGIGKAIPSSLFIMWCKKCWAFLDSAGVPAP